MKSKTPHIGLSPLTGIPSKPESRETSESEQTGNFETKEFNSGCSSRAESQLDAEDSSEEEMKKI